MRETGRSARSGRVDVPAQKVPAPCSGDSPDKRCALAGIAMPRLLRAAGQLVGNGVGRFSRLDDPVWFTRTLAAFPG
jgi:hypothetical protein